MAAVGFGQLAAGSLPGMRWSPARTPIRHPLTGPAEVLRSAAPVSADRQSRNGKGTDRQCQGKGLPPLLAGTGWAWTKPCFDAVYTGTLGMSFTRIISAPRFMVGGSRSVALDVRQSGTMSLTI